MIERPLLEQLAFALGKEFDVSLRDEERLQLVVSTREVALHSSSATIHIGSLSVPFAIDPESFQRRNGPIGRERLLIPAVCSSERSRRMLGRVVQEWRRRGPELTVISMGEPPHDDPALRPDEVYPDLDAGELAALFESITLCVDPSGGEGALSLEAITAALLGVTTVVGAIPGAYATSTAFLASREWTTDAFVETLQGRHRGRADSVPWQAVRNAVREAVSA